MGESVRRRIDAAAKLVGVGRGVSLAHQEASGGESRANVAFQPDGVVVLSTPVFEQGTGTYTMLQQVVAERLGLPADRVIVRVLDTDGFDFDSGMSAQRGTRVGSQVAHAAAEAAQAELARLAADVLGWPEEQTRISGKLIELAPDSGPPGRGGPRAPDTKHKKLSYTLRGRPGGSL